MVSIVKAFQVSSRHTCVNGGSYPPTKSTKTNAKNTNAKNSKAKNTKANNSAIKTVQSHPAACINTTA
ncbi:hypothetical protein JCM33374_g1716 [Metschnikowia sp. JCM 33374]|nr:hypothetical protein JCM33374_g1716 [Metschnikowia sp. JCM 33374]